MEIFRSLLAASHETGLVSLVPVEVLSVFVQNQLLSIVCRILQSILF
jgi:hypothetical protein